MDSDIPDELWQAMYFCTENKPSRIDEERQAFLDMMYKLKESLAESRIKWHENVAEQHRKLLSGIDVPLISALQQIYNIEDEALVHDLTTGFPMTGEMVNDCGGLRDGDWDQGMKKEDVVKEAMKYNASMLTKVRENEWSKDVHDQQWEDAREGFQSEPIPIDRAMGSSIHKECLITRGIPVREHREGRGDRTRTVFHFTESLVNLCLIHI